MALTLYYLVNSFSAELPWSKCNEEWGSNCIDSKSSGNVTISPGTTYISSAEFYFTYIDFYTCNKLFEIKFWSIINFLFRKSVLNEVESIEDGIGLPNLWLSVCLFASWFCVSIVLSQGVKSTGKASYFLAIFPYTVLLCLLARSLTLEGSMRGVMFFLTPQWSKLLDPKVWYAAVTQCFFSLSVCFGAIITYSSHNDFKHNIYRWV